MIIAMNEDAEKGNERRPSEFLSVRTEPSHRWMKSLLKDYKQALEGIDGG